MKPPSPSSDHFKGKSVAEHLKEARLKGSIASGEIHGTELPGHISAAADSTKDTACALLIFWAVASAFITNQSILLPLFATFAFGWIVWKAGRSALLGYGRLERLHRVIEEERWEIQHNREQEKQELREMYEVKGFSGQLLDEVVDVLMADDNRLLRVMLEEELGLSLEVYEHPLKQAFGAGLGALATSALMVGALAFWSTWGIPLFALMIVMASSAIIAKKEKRYLLGSVIWNFALTLFSSAGAYFLARYIANS